MEKEDQMMVDKIKPMHNIKFDDIGEVHLEYCQGCGSNVWTRFHTPVWCWKCRRAGEHRKYAREQKEDVRSQKSEVRYQWSDLGKKKSEVRRDE